MWKEWRIFKGNSKKERFREHDRYNHSTQLSLSSVVEKSKELVVKKKKSAAESIPDLLSHWLTSFLSVPHRKWR